MLFYQGFLVIQTIFLSKVLFNYTFLTQIFTMLIKFLLILLIQFL